jgi:hypothetical protein
MNGQKKKDKRPNNDLQNNAHTTNDREAGNPTKIDATSDNFVNTTNGNIWVFFKIKSASSYLIKIKGFHTASEASNLT